MQTEQGTASVRREGDRIEELLSTGAAALQEKKKKEHTQGEREQGQDEI